MKTILLKKNYSIGNTWHLSVTYSNDNKKILGWRIIIEIVGWLNSWITDNTAQETTSKAQLIPKFNLLLPLHFVLLVHDVRTNSRIEYFTAIAKK